MAVKGSRAVILAVALILSAVKREEERSMRSYGTVTGPVDPREARKGTFLKSFEMGEFKEMLKFCGETKAAMVAHAIQRELVFTKVNRWGLSRKHDMWQVFLVQ